VFPPGTDVPGGDALDWFALGFHGEIDLRLPKDNGAATITGQRPDCQRSSNKGLPSGRGLCLSHPPMPDVELTESLLSKIAGWQAMKEARALLSAGRVLEASWKAPELKGLIEDSRGPMTAGLTIKSTFDVDNRCP